MRGIGVGVGDTRLLQDVADGIVNIVVGHLALAGAEGPCARGKAIQRVIGETAAPSVEDIRDTGHIAGIVVSVGEVLHGTCGAAG